MFRLLSWLFHPFSFPLLGTIILFNTNTYINFSSSPQLKIAVYILLCVNTMILPTIIGWYLAKRNRVTSIRMETIEDRKIIFIVTLVFYVSSLFLLSSMSVPGAIYKLALGGTFTVGALFIFALMRKKLSVHMAGMGGLVGAFIMLSVKLQIDFISIIVIFILLSGLIGMARMIDGDHKENEIYWGFLLGFFSQVFIFT